MCREFGSEVFLCACLSAFCLFDLFPYFHLFLYFVGEGKTMINDQQGSELPWPVQPPVFGQQTDHRQRRSRQQLVVGASLLVTASLLLVLALLFAGWRTPRATPHLRHALPTTHVKPAMEQLTPTRQATPTPQTALIASQVDRLLTNMVTHQQFSGSVLIALDGQMILNRGYSMADWDRQVSNTPRTKFYLGSTTKQFTAMAILILQERGKLQVHDHICSYIAPCPPAWQPVTINV